jgi:hypothetical protein
LPAQGDGQSGQEELHPHISHDAQDGILHRTPPPSPPNLHARSGGILRNRRSGSIGLSGGSDPPRISINGSVGFLQRRARSLGEGEVIRIRVEP